MSLHAVFSIKYPKNSFLFFVQIFNDWLGVVESGCCKHIDVVVFIHFFKELKAVWTDIEFELISLDGEADISFFQIKNGMDERFV